jgi:hypothetical protein
MAARKMTTQGKALLEWGSRRQMMKTAEEFAEAAASIMRWLNIPTDESYTAMIDELADAEICTAYPRLIFGDDVIQEAVDRKLKRLEGMMKVGEK